MSQFDRTHATSFLLNFNRNHASILYRFRDIASHLSYGVTPVEFRRRVLQQKTRVPWLYRVALFA